MTSVRTFLLSHREGVRPGERPRRSIISRLVSFLLGLAFLAIFAGFFMSGVTPPGVVGEVLRHNRANDIDASPLFYSEVEHMSELERAVAARREALHP